MRLDEKINEVFSKDEDLQYILKVYNISLDEFRQFVSTIVSNIYRYDGTYDINILGNILNNYIETLKREYREKVQGDFKYENKMYYTLISIMVGLLYKDKPLDMIKKYIFNSPEGFYKDLKHYYVIMDYLYKLYEKLKKSNKSFQ